MLDYNSSPLTQFIHNGIPISSFLRETEVNLDIKTVESFGDEWNRFKEFDAEEITKIGQDYFDLIDISTFKDKICLDVGCGSGRWAKYLNSHVKFIEAIDPSRSVFSAVTFLKDDLNVRVTQAGVESIPFPDNSFDFVYSLGVLHHLPNTERAIKRCFEKTKRGGWFLLYLYYNLDNRSNVHKVLFQATHILRKGISKMPAKGKAFICDIIAALIYWPFSKIASIFSLFSKQAADTFPLGYYRKVSFHIMRNDALDRFGTPLEKRFSKQEIEAMLIQSGFNNLTFSMNPPYWHVIAQKP